MLPKSKWIKGLTADQPYSDAARQAVGERLPLVWHYLPLAAARHDDKIEFVHQLRVATRRAGAALEVFSEALPPRRAKRIKSKLRRVRRAAGDARDLDVLAQRLTRDTNGYTHVLDEIRLRRIRAQEPIIAAHDKLKRKNFDRDVDELVARIRWRGRGAEPTLLKAARKYLRPIAKRFLRQTKADLSDMDELHRLRKDAKQLRYALELFAGAFDASFCDDLYNSVEQIQVRLGKINDHHVAHAYFHRWSRSANNRLARSFRDLAVEENDAMLIKADAFRGWLHSEHTSKLAARLKQLR